MLTATDITNFVASETGKGVLTLLLINPVSSAIVKLFEGIQWRTRWVAIGALHHSLAISAISALILWLLVYYSLITERYALYAFCASSTILAITNAFEFHKIGILRAYGSTTHGISYARSLSQPMHSFDFLGVGADKLTSDSEFSSMVERCASGKRPIRFLLSVPDSPILKAVAARRDLKADLYETRVTNSIKRLAELKVKKGFNIQVRHYPSLGVSPFHQFRLVFIDDKYCIMGYTVWDQTEGKNNPQLVLRAQRKWPNSSSLYYALEDYYESLWTDERTKEVKLEDFAD